MCIQWTSTLKLQFREKCDGIAIHDPIFYEVANRDKDWHWLGDLISLVKGVNWSSFGDRVEWLGYHFISEATRFENYDSTRMARLSFYISSYPFWKLWLGLNFIS